MASSLWRKVRAFQRRKEVATVVMNRITSPISVPMRREKWHRYKHYRSYEGVRGSMDISWRTQGKLAHLPPATPHGNCPSSATGYNMLEIVN
jgi:hypothetical protein